MSLIDEALKRAQAAHQEEKKREERARPWSPAPLPDRGRITRGRIRRVAILVLASAALVVAGVFFFRSSLLRAPFAHPARSLQTSPFVTDLPPITSEVVVPPPPKGLSSSAERPERILPAPTSVPSVSAGKRPSPPAALAEPSSPSGPASGRPAPPPAGAGPSTREPKPHGVLEGRTYAAEIPLPGGGKISLDGIVYSETNPVAVLDGRVVAAGGYVEGFTVVRILPDRVELEKDGTKFFLTLH